MHGQCNNEPTFTFPVTGHRCLPLLILPCTIKSRVSLLAPADPGGPGKRAVKRLLLLLCHRTLLPATVARLNCFMTEAHVCEQLAQGRYLTVEWPGVELATSQLARP